MLITDPLWNRKLTKHPQLLKKTDFPWINTEGISNRRMYYFLSSVLFLLERIIPDTSFKTKIKLLTAEHPGIELSEMGFPNDWEKQPLWSD
ncbi:MAG: hypothetical protein ACK4S4_01190 [Pyrinomonadaceae bacterium]